MTAKNPGLAFDPPATDGPCGCGSCLENRRVEEDRARFAEYGCEVLGYPKVCLRLAERAAHRARVERRAEP